MDNYYLKPNIKMDPLIWNWYAWPYLIPPATAGCNIIERHIKIMESYIMAPKLHADAVKNPALLGGPFIDLEGQRVEEIKNLLSKTKNDCAALIQLAQSLKAFDRILQAEGQGNSLELLYQQIPANLKGLIELVYDLNSHPSIRLIEALFYQKFYSTNHQSLALAEINEDYRPFVMSTPRLEKANEIYLNLPFSDARIDTLFSMRHTPKSSQEIKSFFDIPANKIDLFDSFFTTETPTLSESRNYSEDNVRLRYFGHACVLLQTNKISILLDPVISYKVNSEIPRYTYEDLPDNIDYVLLTHNHQDHVLFETLLQIRHKIGKIVLPLNQKGALADPSLKLILINLGFNNLITLDDMETLSIADGEIISIPFLGEHSDLNIQSKHAYFVNIKGRKFIFAADSNNLANEMYEHIFQQIGAIDVLFLGMECEGAPLSWLYGPLLSKPLNRTHDYSRQLSGSNSAKAWSLVQHSKSKNVYIYAMGQEPWLNYIMSIKYSDESIQIKESNHLIKKCHDNNITAERLFGKKEYTI